MFEITFHTQPSGTLFNDFLMGVSIREANNLSVRGCVSAPFQNTPVLCKIELEKYKNIVVYHYVATRCTINEKKALFDFTDFTTLICSSVQTVIRGISLPNLCTTLLML